MLRCKVNPSIGFIIAGHQSMECSFTPNGPNPPEAYEGALNMIGLDIGISAGGVFGWAVFAPTTGIPAGALAGEYVGASGDIGLGVGVGANVLIGGSGRTVRAAADLSGGFGCRRRCPWRVWAQAEDRVLSSRTLPP